MDWRTIDSAPKDATSILGVYDGEIRIVFWLNGRWKDDDGDAFCPTHWMPLPPLPAKAPQ